MINQQGLTIHDEGKIDIHNRIAKYQIALARLGEDKKITPENKELILKFLRDCEIGKTIFGKARKKIGAARCLKYLGILRQLSVAFGKAFDIVTQEDMENFIGNLESDKIKAKSGKSYSQATKADIKKTIKKFWKWKDGGNKSYPQLVEWIDTYEAIKEVPALNRSEMERMIESTTSLRDKALIMILFDSGARVEELMNVRLKKEHLFWKEETGCFMIRLEYSKTKPRTISLPLSTEYIRRWLEVHPAKENPQAQLFPMTYPALKMVVMRLGKKAVGKRVTPHMLRHSSATFYANKLKNPFKLCYRYGWAMSSNMVNRYLDREGLLEEETANVVKTDEISTATKANKNLSEELILVKESQSEMLKRYEELKKELQSLQSGKGILSLLMSLRRRQEDMSSVLGKLTGEKFDIILPSGVPEEG